MPPSGWIPPIPIFGVKGDLLYQNGSWSKALEAYEEVKEIIPEKCGYLDGYGGLL